MFRCREVLPIQYKKPFVKIGGISQYTIWWRWAYRMDSYRPRLRISGTNACMFYTKLPNSKNCRSANQHDKPRAQPVGLHYYPPAKDIHTEVRTSAPAAPIQIVTYGADLLWAH